MNDQDFTPLACHRTVQRERFDFRIINLNTKGLYNNEIVYIHVTVASNKSWFDYMYLCDMFMFAKRLYLCEIFMSFLSDKGKDYACVICYETILYLCNMYVHVCQKITLVRYVHEFLKWQRIRLCLCDMWWNFSLCFPKDYTCAICSWVVKVFWQSKAV